MQLSDYNSQIRELTHDLATVDWTDSELTTYINNARQRVALDAHCVRMLVPNLNLVQNQETYPQSGGIGGYLVTNGGSNYTAPTVTVGAPPVGGVQATATIPSAGIVGGVITLGNAICIPSAWGAGYTSTPTVTVNDATGSGAVVTPIPLLNVLAIVSVSVIWPGSLMSRTLNWSPFTEFQAWARSYRGSFGWPAEWSEIREQNIFYVSRIPDQAYGVELDVATLPNPLVNLTDVDTQVVQPWADAVQWWGAYLAILKLQNYAHASYLKKEYQQRLREVLVTKQPRRIRNVYLATYRRRMRGG